MSLADQPTTTDTNDENGILTKAEQDFLEFIVNWIDKIKRRIASIDNGLVYDAVRVDTLQEYEKFSYYAWKYGLLVLKSIDNRAYPKLIFTLSSLRAEGTIGNSNVFPEFLEPHTTRDFIREVKKIGTAMEENKVGFWPLAIVSPNVATAQIAIGEFQKTFGDRFMVSHSPDVTKKDDRSKFVWFMAISNRLAVKEAEEIFFNKVPAAPAAPAAQTGETPEKDDNSNDDSSSSESRGPRKIRLEDLKDPNDSRPMASASDLLKAVKAQHKEHKATNSTK